MGLFGSSKRLHLNSRELRNLLDRVPGLDNEEEEDVLAKLEQYRSGGLSRGEIERAVRELKYDREDSVARDEAERVKEALLAALEEE